MVRWRGNNPKNGSYPLARRGKQPGNRRHSFQEEPECLPGNQSHASANTQLLRNTFQMGKKPAECLQC